MATIQIRIGAQVDASVAKSFEQVEQRAARANSNIRGISAKTSTAMGQGAAKQVASEDRMAAARAKSHERLNAQIARIESKAVSDSERRRQQSVKNDLRAFDQRIRASQKASQAEERDIIRVAAAANRAEARRKTTEGNRTTNRRNAFTRDFGHSAVANMGSAARFGMGIAGQAARGLGLQPDVTSLVARASDLQETASRTTLSASAAEGKDATPADVKVTADAIRNAADASGQDFNKMAAGLEEFVAKSSDLGAGKEMLAELGRVAKATGTDVNELVAAAGAVTKTFDAADPEKTKKTMEVIRMLAKQGSLGSVEIKDMAQFSGRLTGTAGLFKGDRATNIGKVGMLAQMAMGGGASDAAEATNSAGSFARDISKGAARKRFEAAGINVFADEGKTKLNSPEDIIKATLFRTNGDLGQISDLFKNDVSMRPVRAAAQIYNNAGGGEKGMAAVDAEMKKFSSTMSEAQVATAFATAQSTDAAKMQALQNRLDRVTAQSMEKLIPALEKLAPAAVSVADLFAKVATFAAENPGAAITAAIVGSILKAGIGAAVSNSVTGAIGTAGSAAAPVVGSLLAGFIIGAALDSMDAAADAKADKTTRAGLNETTNAASELRQSMGDGPMELPTVGAMGVSRTDDPLEKVILERAQAERREKQKGSLGSAQAMAERKQAEIDKVKAEGADQSVFDYLGGGYASAAANWISAGGVGKSLDMQSGEDSREEMLPQMQQELAGLKAAIAEMSAKLSGNLNVTVTSMPGGAPTVDPDGRQPRPGK